MPRWLHAGVAARYLLHEAFNISLQNERKRGREGGRNYIKPTELDQHAEKE